MASPCSVSVEQHGVSRPWWAPALVAGILQLIVMGAYAARFEGDPSAFVCAAPEDAGRWPLEHVRVGQGAGFDGQYYYVIARDPWKRQDPRYVRPPAYRHLRLLYPALAWAISGRGGPEALLWALPGINLAAFAALAGLGSWWAVQFGRSRWWGVAVPLLLNAGTPALRDLTDPVALAAVFGLLLAWLGHWPLPVTIVLALAAVLSRETNVAIVGILLAAAAIDRDWIRASAMLLVMLAWAGWVAHLWTTYQESPFVAGNFGAPFHGIAYRLEHLRGDVVAGRGPIHLVGLAYLGCMMLTAAVMPFLRSHAILALTALLGSAMALCAGPAIFMDGHSYTRVFVFLPLGILLWALQSGRSWPLLALSPAILWPAYALVQVWLR